MLKTKERCSINIDRFCLFRWCLMQIYEKNLSGAGFLARIHADNLTYRAHLHLCFNPFFVWKAKSSQFPGKSTY